LDEIVLVVGHRAQRRIAVIRAFGYALGSRAISSRISIASSRSRRSSGIAVLPRDASRAL
jgi:hypothetical protein